MPKPAAGLSSEQITKRPSQAFLSWQKSLRMYDMCNTIKTEAKVIEEKISLEDINLWYEQAKDLTNGSASRFYPVVPYNAFNSANYAQPFRKQLSMRSLEKTHILHVTQGKYATHSVEASIGQDGISLETVVRRIEGNVCALSKGKGQPFASALLIAPNIILTARHCIENNHIPSIHARIGYQLTSIGVSYGSSFPLECVLEESVKFDYAIVKLSQNVPSFIPIRLLLTNAFTGESIFIHHPDGQLKKVSVHTTPETDYFQYSYAGFHDSWVGSSGAGYFDEEGRLFALHSAYPPGVMTTGVFIKDIMRESHILKNMYYGKKEIDFNGYKKMIFVAPTQTGRNFEKKLETNFLHLTPLENSKEERHHIIPDGDMQFLWLLGQECPKIKKTLVRLAYKPPEEIYTETINAMEWAPWNIFIGPKHEFRAFDPGGNRPEPICPLSFDKKLWEAIQKLYKLINECWSLRFTLNEQIAEGQAAYRKQQILQLSHYDGSLNLTPDTEILIQRTKPRRSKIEQYLYTLNGLLPTLHRIEHEYRRFSHGIVNYMHQTILDGKKMIGIGSQLAMISYSYEAP